MEHKKITFQRQRLLKNYGEKHKILIKKYKINFNPLLLPKMAVFGYQIKPDPSCQIFISKLQLFDKAVIERENDFISEMHKFMKVRQQEMRVKKQTILRNMLNMVTQQIDLNLYLEQVRYKYSLILNSRLKDLNQFIFHIERFNQEPQLQKQCRILLQIQINKLIQSSSEQKVKKIAVRQSRIEQSERYFHLSDFKLQQKNKKDDNIKKMYQTQSTKRSCKNKRIVTEPSTTNYTSQLAKGNNVQRKSQIQQTFTIIKENNFQFLDRKRKDSKQIRFSQANNNQNILQTQYATHRFATDSKNIAKNRQKKLNFKTQQNQSTRIWNQGTRLGKSVRYNIQQNNKQQKLSDNQKPLNIHNFKSSKIVRDKHENGLRQSDDAKPPTSRKSAKKNKLQSSKSFKCEIQMIDSELQHDIYELGRNKNNDKNVHFFEQENTEKKDFVKIRQNYRSGKMMNERLKLSASVLPSQIYQQRQRSRSNDSKYSRQHIKSTARRQAAFQQSDKLKGPNPYRRNMSKSKRNGKILGIEANKNLGRLLRQSTIEDMMLSSQLQGATEFLIKMGFNSNKGNIAKINKNTNKHVMSNKNKIMLEVDVQASHKEKISTKDKQMQNYASSGTFIVKASDLATVRKNFVSVNPYHHRQIAHFYGGQKLQQINYEIITNELGQYSFNRQFIQKIKKEQQQQYLPYKFPDKDPCDFMSIQLCKQMIKTCYDIDQKSVTPHSIIL